MSRHRRREPALALLSLLALPLLGSCARTISVLRLDDLNRTTAARTVVLAPEYSLYSPFELGRTQRFVELVDQELAAVTTLFEYDPPEPVVIWLEAVDGLAPLVTTSADGESISVRMPARHPLNGIEGLSYSRVAIVYVDRPQTIHLASGPVEGGMSAATYASTLRHELAHVCSAALGLTTEDWLSEGLAHEIDARDLVDGVLVPDPDAVRLRDAAALPRSRRSLPALLAWGEDVAGIRSGRVPATPDSRRLAHAFVYFLLQRDPEPRFAQKLEGVRRLSHADLLALDGEWQDWLDDQARQRNDRREVEP